MRLKKTARGFARGEFKDANGKACSIQKSSVATSDMIWLGINDPAPMQLRGDGTGWRPYPLPASVLCDTRMHLTRSHAKRLVVMLARFAETGEL